jgi:hypothetical protein
MWAHMHRQGSCCRVAAAERGWATSDGATAIARGGGELVGVDASSSHVSAVKAGANRREMVQYGHILLCRSLYVILVEHDDSTCEGITTLHHNCSYRPAVQGGAGRAWRRGSKRREQGGFR